MFGQPLAADVLHHRVPSSLRGLEDVPHQRAGPAGLQLHRLQVSRPQFAAEQVSFDLRAHGKHVRVGEIRFPAASMLAEKKPKSYLVFTAFGLQNETVQFFGLEN